MRTLRLMPQRVASWGVKFYSRERPSSFEVGLSLGVGGVPVVMRTYTAA